MDKYGLLDKANEKAKNLTVTQKLRLDFARAFARQVSLLILDDCFGKDADADAFLTEQIPSLHSNGCSILILCNDVSQTIGRTFDFLPKYEKQN